MKAVLRPLKGHSHLKPVYYATADIESYEWINFLVIGYYDGYDKYYKYYENLETFVTEIFDRSYESGVDNIFMHFGGKFDFNFVIEAVLKTDRYCVNDMIPRGSGLLSFSIFEKKVTKWVNREKKKPFILKFRDSSALLPFALRSLCKAFKVKTQKGDIDFEFIEDAYKNKNYLKKLLKRDDINVFYDGTRIKTYKKEYKKDKIYYIKPDGTSYPLHGKKDILHYLKHDCIGLWEVLDAFYSWPLVEKSGKSFTTASQAVKIWRTFLKCDVHGLSKSVDRFIRCGYFGGRTEIFRPFFHGHYNVESNPDKFPRSALKYLREQKKVGKLYYYDVNSLYPTVMRDNEFPIKFKGWVEADQYDKNSLTFWECEVDVPKMFCPPLGVKHVFENGTVKYIFPTGVFKGIWTTQELEYAKTLGVKVLKIHRGAIFENGGYIFKDFITELYNIRLKAKKKKDGVNDLNSKLIMNSCYGRLGLNLEREKLVFDDGQNGFKIHSEVKMGKRNIRLGTEDVYLESSFTNVAISAYVTAYARILMHRDGYMKAGEKHLYYTDTDSMFCSKKLPTGDGLGEWKLEYTCKSACFLLPKTYINDGVEGEDFTKKLTMKGFDKKKIQHFEVQDFLEALRGDMGRLKVFQDAKFATLKSALKRGVFLDLLNDPESNKKSDIRKLEKNKQELISAQKKDDKEEIRKIRARIKRLEKKLASGEYNLSERSIKSQYDKRVIIEHGFTSEPIHLTEDK